MFVVALILTPICFLGENACEWLADVVSSAAGWPATLSAIQSRQLAQSSHWSGLISPLLVAPVVENLLCLGWLLNVFDRLAGWWRGPACVALIAAGFHVLAYLEPRYIAVVVPFFAMCCLMANVRDRRVGYWASVLLHAAGNALVFGSMHL